ncbi:MAG: two-component sensor histidine kinase [Acidimicrobiales bacterium]|nr:two-component sensor histidine kinase [Hyphomonadaceae bacterium]RZV43541.1 MAG: two-component sensor histidine kinase [Acidimicrobiales bacterium]
MDNQAQSSILSAIPYPALILDADFYIKHANAPAANLFEMDMEGLRIVRVSRQPEILNCVQNALNTGKIQIARVVLNLVRPRTYQISAAPFEGLDGTKGSVLVTYLDVSAEIDAENARSTFVANVSHELRSPLTSLLGVVETLQGPARNDEKARDRFLALMHDETQRMSRLVGDLLSLAKLESKEHVKPKNRVNIERVIKRVVDSLEASNADHKDRVQIKTDPDLPEIAGDSDELTEVFQNLLENALKYSSPETPVDVSIGQKSAIDPSKAGHVFVEIVDQGDGIAPEHLPRLTERFYRVDKGRSREMGGTGLGLAITKHILNRHRGKMSFDSELGEGTTVTIELRI